jgi:hypothetical protein
MREAGSTLIESGRANNQRGFSLIMLALCAIVVLGVLGLAVCAKLDGSGSGVTAADTIATQGPLGTTVPNGWKFDTVAITNVTTGYTTSRNGTYDSAATASAVNSNTYAVLSVTPQVTMSPFFLPVISGIPVQYTLSAKVVGGQRKQTSDVTGGGLAPLAPEARELHIVI